MAYYHAIRTLYRITRGKKAWYKDLQHLIDDLRQLHLQGKVPAFQTNRTRSRWFSVEKLHRHLRKIQSIKLQKTVRYAFKYIPYYQRKLTGFPIKEIQTIDDIIKLPFTFREDLQENVTDFISQYPGLNPTVQTLTTGTTGKHNLLYLTNDEFEYFTSGQALLGLLGGGMGPRDIYQIHMQLDDSTTGVFAYRAAEKAGSLIISFGSHGTLEEHVESIFEERNLPGKNAKVSSLLISPSHLWALTQKAVSMGKDFSQSGLTYISTGGAMVSEDLKKKVAETWGVRLIEGYSMVETPGCVAAECPEGNMHFLDITGYIEAIDPDTKQPVPPGKPGVAAITAFYPERELIPLIRYWTNDLITIAPGYDCPCGMPTTQIAEIHGRYDQMLIVGGWNFYPQEVGDSLLAFPELLMPPHFDVRLEEKDDAHFVVIRIELKQELEVTTKKQLAEKIHQNVAFSHYWQTRIGSVKVKVELVTPGTITKPFSYKHVGLVTG